MTSQEDMSDSHYLPLDVASTFDRGSVLFLCHEEVLNLNRIYFDAGLDLVLESYPQHTFY